MVTALYRRYRPETFAELIGQSQVTDPLRTALRTNRVNHAYLFSGPRGCGKTTSARILARCLNCVEGPTDTPCGTCPSCIELSRDGGGSLDVVEIDAASHNGVDDARELRERAIFAPARDRYKIFILDEAHMVTPQGFNALLKIVEEPPEHVKFIFATTEPDKVIGTIRSRTHHYPFRLVPPAQLLEYVQQLSVSEKIEVEPGVLSLVVRAGGGSVRDTLSILDQLIAGSEAAKVGYERAVSLLGYTHASLLAEVVGAIGARDAAAVFSAVDRVIQTGQDPRRFVEDLLERLRDLIVVAATGAGAAAVLRGVQQDELDRMAQEAAAFGAAELSRAADVANSALTEMSGATSPRLQLELMMARILVPASDDSARGTLARVERLERRIGVVPAVASESAALSPLADSDSATASPARASAPAAPPAPPQIAPDPASAAAIRQSRTAPAAQSPVPVTLQQIKDSWPEILEKVERSRRSAWMIVFTAKPLHLAGEVLTLSFPSENDVANFRPQPGAESASEILRQAIVDVLGIRVKFLPKVEAGGQAVGEDPIRPGAPDDSAGPASSSGPAEEAAGWAVASIPVASIPGAGRPSAGGSDAPTQPDADASAAAPVKSVVTSPSKLKPAKPASVEKARYGEAVVREILGASFIEEQAIAPSSATPSPKAD